MAAALARHGAHEAELDEYSCFGRCQRGVNVLIRPLKSSETKEERRRLMLMPTSAPGALLYNRVQLGEIDRIVEEHLLADRPIFAWTQRPPTENSAVNDACTPQKLER